MKIEGHEICFFPTQISKTALFLNKNHIPLSLQRMMKEATRHIK